MNFWIAVIGSKLTKKRFDDGETNWFCLPKSCDIGDQVMMYAGRKACNDSGIFAIYTVVDKNTTLDKLCSHYGKLSGTGERPIHVMLKLQRKFGEVISLEKIKHQATLSSTIYVRRNFQATYFKITSREFDLLASISL